MAEHAAVTDDKEAMKDILSSLGLQSLYENFTENKVGPKEVEALSEEQFAILGVDAVGDRARLKQMCKDFMKGTSLNSLTVRKFLELSSKRHGKTYRRKKQTRKIYIGWKNLNEKGVYALMHPSKGGGQHVKDINIDVSLHELEEILCNEYFPDGICLTSNMLLKDYTVSVVNYAGHVLPETVCGEPFSVGRYCDSRKCTPIRIYLQTKKVSTIAEGGGMINEGNGKETRGSSTVTEVIEEDEKNMDVENSDDHFEMKRTIVEGSSTNFDCSTVTEGRSIEIGDSGTRTEVIEEDKKDVDVENSDDDFEMAQFVPMGTPTVCFNRRAPNRLSLIQIRNRGRLSQDQTASPPQTPSCQQGNSSVYSIIESDSDSDLQEAIKKSVEPKQTFEIALQNWRKEQLVESDQNFIIVNRNDVMDSLKRAQKKKTFSWLKPSKIIFSGEDGEDFGGPKREFFGDLN